MSTSPISQQHEIAHHKDTSVNQAGLPTPAAKTEEQDLNTDTQSIDLETQRTKNSQMAAATEDSTEENFIKKTGQQIKEAVIPKDKYQMEENDALGNAIKSIRNGTHKLGTGLMVGSGSIGATLYLLLGWRKIGLFVGVLGAGAGYFINKFAKFGAGEETEKSMLELVKKSNWSKEYKLAMLELMKEAKNNPEANTSNAQNIKENIAHTLNKIWLGVQELSRSPNQTAPEAT